MQTPFPRWIARLAPKLPLLVCLLVAAEALARVGGGEHYTSSRSSSSGSSDSGGDGEGLFIIVRLLAWLVWHHPAIGIPLTLAIIAVVVHAQRNNATSATRRAFSEADHAEEARARVTASAADTWVRQLEATDPGFELMAFLDRVREQWFSVQDAWFKRDLGPVRRRLSDATWQRLYTQLELLRRAGVRDAVAGLEVLDLSIVGFERTAAFDTVQVRVRARGHDAEAPATATDLEARAAAREAPIEGFVEIWSLVRRPGVKTPAVAPSGCPRCGAPWTPGAATNLCDHCGALVNSGAHDWVLAEITQDVEHLPEAAAPQGLEALLAQDPAFHLEGLEDRVSLCFWKWVQAEESGQGAPLGRVATPAFGRKMDAELASLPSGRRLVRDCAVGAVNLVRVDTEGPLHRAHLEVRWSARWSAELSNPGPITPRRWVFTLTRAADAKTDAAHGLATASCPGCGAPSGESTAPACEYCALVLGASDRDWNLADAQPWERWAATEPAPAAARPADRDERRRLLHLLAAVAKADGTVDARERKLLFACASRWGLSAGEVASALAAPAVGADEALAKDSAEARALLDELTKLALVDGRVDRTERALIEACAAHLGVSAPFARRGLA